MADITSKFYTLPKLYFDILFNLISVMIFWFMTKCFLFQMFNLKVTILERKHFKKTNIAKPLEKYF